MEFDINKPSYNPKIVFESFKRYMYVYGKYNPNRYNPNPTSLITRWHITRWIDSCNLSQEDKPNIIDQHIILWVEVGFIKVENDNWHFV